MEDKTEMAKGKIGLAAWEEQLSEEERKKLIEKEIWKQDVYDAWVDEKKKEFEKLVKNVKAKSNKKGRRKQQQMEEEYENNTDYVE
jgi:hypothetical protein